MNPVNKTVFAIIILIIIVGAALAVWKVYFSPQRTALAPSAPLTSDQQPSPETISPQPIPDSGAAPPPTTKPPVATQGVLDRIEAAIRAKLER